MGPHQRGQFLHDLGHKSGWRCRKNTGKHPPSYAFTPPRSLSYLMTSDKYIIDRWSRWSWYTSLLPFLMKTQHWYTMCCKGNSSMWLLWTIYTAIRINNKGSLPTGLIWHKCDKKITVELHCNLSWKNTVHRQ